MPKFSCSSCRFKFNYLTAPKKCPYCSKEGSVSLEQSAEAIMGDINNFLEQQ